MAARKQSAREGSSGTNIVPGQVWLVQEPIQANVARATVTLDVTNTGDRPIQVGSHFHFFEVNRALSFDRTQSFGMRLNIPSGNAVRFEPGQTQTVRLVDLGGKGLVHGFNALASGSVRTGTGKQQAIAQMRDWLGDND